MFHLYRYYPPDQLVISRKLTYMPFFVPKSWNGRELFMTILHLAYKVPSFVVGCIFCQGEYIFMYF